MEIANKFFDKYPKALSEGMMFKKVICKLEKADKYRKKKDMKSMMECLEVAHSMIEDIYKMYQGKEDSMYKGYQGKVE